MGCVGVVQHWPVQSACNVGPLQGFVRFLNPFPPLFLGSLASHVMLSFINVFNIVCDKSRLDKSLPQWKKASRRLPSKIAKALSCLKAWHMM